MSPRRLSVFTPWYPSLGNPVLGNFVADWSRLASGGFDIEVVHTTEWPGGPVEVVDANVAPFDALVARMGKAGLLTARGSFGRITRVPHALVGGWSVPERAESAVAAARRALPAVEAEVVHGHVSYFGGLVAARLAAPQSRVVVTEHSSEARTVLSDPRGLELYTEVLERAAYLTCVSGVVRDLIVEHVPRFADKVVVVPNPVDFDASPRRQTTPERLDRWVFVGGLLPIKGVERLIRAFIAFAADRPDATLDLFGDGHLRAALEDAVAEAGLKRRVTFHGNVPRATVLKALPSYDVLVAPSVRETFHLAVPEAVAAGLPVVVSRSGGPEEALGDTVRLCGVFIDVNEEADEIVDAVRRVEADLPGLDLDAARAELAARYGTEAVRERLAELYDAEPWQPGAPLPVGAGPVPEHVEVYARRTWRSPAVEPQIALAEANGVGTQTIGVPQPKQPQRPLTVPQRAVRKARRILSGLLPQHPTAPGAGTVAILGDFTSGADLAARWDKEPALTPTVELDPTLFGEPPVDGPPG